MNPVFNHEGATILTYLPTGNPLTLESILYGVAASTWFFLWFAAEPMLEKLDRIKVKYGLIA